MKKKLYTNKKKGFVLSFCIVISLLSLLLLAVVRLYPINWGGISAMLAGLFLGAMLLIAARDVLAGRATMRREDQNFQALARHSQTPFALVTEDGATPHRSDALARLAGQPDARDLFRRIASGDGPLPGEKVELRVGKGKHPFLVRFGPAAPGRSPRYVELIDATSIAKARRHAVEAANAKSAFFANMSHAIRTPLGTITGVTDLLRRTQLSPEQVAYITGIQNASRSLLGIVDDVLDFSQADAYSVYIQARSVSVASVLGDIANAIGLRASLAGIAFTIEMQGAIPAQVRLDEMRLKQVLTGLIGNAMRHASRGSVALTCAYEGSARLRFTVRATGQALSWADHDALIRDLGQHPRRLASEGLAANSHLVQLMGGRMLVFDAAERGAHFAFELPAPTEDEQPLVAPFAPGECRVLCYEPHPHDAAALAAMLAALGAGVTMCQDADAFAREIARGSYRGAGEWYTHVLFRRSALRLIDPRVRESARLIVLRDLRERYLFREADIPYVAKPVLITTLARALRGEYDTAPPRAHRAFALGSLHLKGTRVLLVDDNAVNLFVARAMLQQYGIQVTTARDGREAIEKIRDMEAVVDMVFMDHMMPRMNGIEATRAIRALGGRLARVPIVAFTANAMPDIRRLCQEAGMDGFLAKPIDPRLLSEVLLRYMPQDKIAQE